MQAATSEGLLFNHFVLALALCILCLPFYSGLLHMSTKVSTKASAMLWRGARVITTFQRAFYRRPWNSRGHCGKGHEVQEGIFATPVKCFAGAPAGAPAM